jgi:hypothetical protein
MIRVRRTAYTLLSLAMPLVAAATTPPVNQTPVNQSSVNPSLVNQEGSGLIADNKKKDLGPLVDKVRRATARYRDINVALGEGFVPATPCVSGPNEGAMGVHYVLGSRVGDGVLKAREPEALIYEPQADGSLRLVGVEFIVLVQDWLKNNPPQSTPALEGHLTNLVGEPNRYGLPSFYEIHVWAWEDNPNGSFADWNTDVNCNHQPLDKDRT